MGCSIGTIPYCCQLQVSVLSSQSLLSLSCQLGIGLHSCRNMSLAQASSATSPDTAVEKGNTGEKTVSKDGGWPGSYLPWGGRREAQAWEPQATSAPCMQHSP